VTQWETTIGLICILTGLIAFGFAQNWRTFSLCLLLIWQGSLYLAAPLYSLLSLKREAILGIQPRLTEQGKPMMEQLAARWVMAISMVLIGAFSLIRFLPTPTGLPDYARFLPIDLSPQELVGQARQPTVNNATKDNITTPEPTINVAPTGATATVTVESANCRKKPRGNADLIIFLYRDQVVEIVGKNDDPINPWWYIKIPDSKSYCWLWGMTSKMNGKLEDIPIVR
jgi:hypothetical protein